MLAEFVLLPIYRDCKECSEKKIGHQDLLLSKMPITIDREETEYKMKIHKREARDLPLKWSYDELAMLLAIDITSNGMSTPGTINIGKHSGKERICVNCGSKAHVVTDKGPAASACATRSARMRNASPTSAQGLRGGICVVCADSMPSNKDAKNALDKPVSEHVYKCFPSHEY